MLLPAVISRYRARFEKLGRPAVIVCCAIAALGPVAVTNVDTHGLHRNAFGALWPRGGKPAAIVPVAAGARISPFGVGEPVGFKSSEAIRPVGPTLNIGSSASTEDLSRFRRAAADRNVVLIVLESTGAQYLKPFGAAEDPMPNLTELARRAILFENAYAVYPESIKGLLSTLCSRYPSFGEPAESDAGIPCDAFSEALRKAGYHTALFHSGRFMYLGMDSVVRNRGFMTLEDAGTISGNVQSSFGVDERAAVQRMLDWIDARPKGTRFFLTYLPIAGHHPYASSVPGPFQGEDEVTRYRNALYEGDMALGEFLHGLRARGLDDRTLFIVFGDHGEGFEQHEGNVGHTMFLYDENIRVPYVIAAPGLIQHAIRVRRAASLIDTAPTILDLVGLPIPNGYQGASLVDPVERMAFFFTDYSLRLLGLRDGCWKYIFELDSTRSKLFNLCNDPAETVDVHDRESERVRTYRERIQPD